MVCVCVCVCVCLGVLYRWTCSAIRDMRGHDIINNTANSLLRGPGFNINKLPALHTHTVTHRHTHWLTTRSQCHFSWHNSMWDFSFFCRFFFFLFFKRLTSGYTLPHEHTHTHTSSSSSSLHPCRQQMVWWASGTVAASWHLKQLLPLQHANCHQSRQHLSACRQGLYHCVCCVCMCVRM